MSDISMFCLYVPVVLTATESIWVNMYGIKTDFEYKFCRRLECLPANYHILFVCFFLTQSHNTFAIRVGWGRLTEQNCTDLYTKCPLQ